MGILHRKGHKNFEEQEIDGNQDQCHNPYQSNSDISISHSFSNNDRSLSKNSRRLDSKFGMQRKRQSQRRNFAEDQSDDEDNERSPAGQFEG